MKPFTGLILVSFCASFMLSACIDPDRYEYDQIKSEYADTICRLNKMEAVSKSTGGTGEACILDAPISLTEAVRIALENNPDTQMAMARVNQARAMADLTRAAYYPAVGFYTEYSQGDAPSAYLFKTIDQRKLDLMTTDLNDPGWYQNFESGLQAKVNLFNGGKDYLNQKMAETGLAAQQMDRQAVENAIIASVINGYYDIQAAKAYIDIAEESTATVQKQLDVMTARYRAGSALKSDILSLEVRLAQAREAVVTSRNRHRMAMAALANVLGVNPDREIIIKTGGAQPLEIPPRYAEGLKLALKNRAELSKIREQLKQARMALDLSKADYFPSLDLQGKYYVDDEKMGYDIDRDNWTAALVLNWYFFTGFSSKAEEKKASAGLEEVLAADRKTVLGIQLDVKNAYLKLEEAGARRAVAEKSVDSAQESLELVRKQFEGGSATITRYLEAELARNTARIRAANAHFDHEKATADVGRSLGLLGPAFRKMF